MNEIRCNAEVPSIFTKRAKLRKIKEEFPFANEKCKRAMLLKWGRKVYKKKGDKRRREKEKCTGVNQFGLDERRSDQSIQRDNKIEINIYKMK